MGVESLEYQEARSWYELITYCIPGPSQWHLEAVMLRLSRDGEFLARASGDPRGFLGHGKDNCDM